MRNGVKWFLLGGTVLAVLVGVYDVFALNLLSFFVTTPLSPPTPTLLLNARSTGGWWDGGCPAGETDQTLTEGRSPQIEDSLRREFPPGSSQQALTRSLVTEGFKLDRPCDSDPSVLRATFQQSGGGLRGPYPAYATVAWKADRAGRLIWTKGNIEFTGP